MKSNRTTQIYDRKWKYTWLSLEIIKKGDMEMDMRFFGEKDMERDLRISFLFQRHVSSSNPKI